MSENNYFKNLEYKTDNLHVLLGKNAGDLLNKDIEEAKSSILVVSPYIASSKIEQLINLSNNGIKVKLVFSEDDKIYSDEETKSTLRKIIKRESIIDENHKNWIQEKNTDITNKTTQENKLIATENTIKNNKLKKTLTIAYCTFGAILLLSIVYLLLMFFYPLPIKEGLSFIHKDFITGSFYNKFFDTCIVVILIIISFKLYNSILNKIKKNSKYKHSNYKTLYTIPYNPKYTHNYAYINDNIRVTYSLKNKKNSSLIHSKYYVIDNRIVYMGSLNFTNNGMNNNIETTIKIDDYILAKEIKDFTNNLFKSGNGLSYHNNFKDSEKWINQNGEEKITRSLAHIIYDKEPIKK